MENIVNPQGERTTYLYDVASRRTVKKLANASRASFTFDQANRLTARYNLKSDDSVISSFDYSYDSAGNRTGVLEATGDRCTWAYDATNQLINEQRSGANSYNTTYVYDPLGNRLVKNASGALTTSTYDLANQLQISEDASGVTTYAFDADGNQQIVEYPDGTRTTNTWDYENRNTRVDLPAGSVATYLYNADGKRVRKET